MQRNRDEASGLIEQYNLEVFTPPCDPGAERYAAKAYLVTDITPVLTLLNSKLKGARYNPAAPALVWKKDGRTIVFHPKELAISNVVDRHEAELEIKVLIDIVNHAWEHRDEIEPSTVVRERPSHLVIFKLIPGTNCKRCGEPTCYNFALKLTTGHSSLDGCPMLKDLEHQSASGQLEDMLGGHQQPA